MIKKIEYFLNYTAALVAIAAVICFLTSSFCIADSGITAWDLISLVNGMRTANGLGALSVDSYVMACAQGTAETMAANNMTWHIGNTAGRISAYGYNNGNTCFATENFMMGGEGTSIASIQSAWSDSSHMIPMTNPSYTVIGAGVAEAANGMTYYIIQAAYPAGGGRSSGKGSTSEISSNDPISSGDASANISQIIKEVTIATADSDGNTYHEVQDGQTLWTIAAAYDTSVEILQSWNNLGESTALKLGQKLFIPDHSQSASTPTPAIELTVLATPDSAGRYYHVVTEGDTLWSISEMWHVPLQSLFSANGIDADTSIGLGWKLSIPVTPTNTVPPTLTPTPTITPENTVNPSETIVISEVPTSLPTPASKSHLPQMKPSAKIILSISVLMIFGIVFLLFDRINKKQK